MKDFFRFLWRKVWGIIFILLFIWLIYFLITFFYPNAFDFLRNKNIKSEFSKITEIIKQEKTPLKIKIYDFFFNNETLKGFSKAFSGINNMTSTNTEILGNNNEPYILGAGTSTTYRNKDILRKEDLYVFPNTKENAVAQNFRFDDILVKEDGANILKDGSAITGEINTHYISTPFFMIDLYDVNGYYIYSISASGRIMPEDENLLTFSSINHNFLNYYGYKGEGFLVIWTDNPEVESVLISKIILE